MNLLQQIFDGIRWLMGLATPENLQQLVNLGGPPWVSYAILAAIVFSETGLLIGFFLPGDSLLFAAGLLASQVNPQTGQPVFDLATLMVLLSIAAIVGDAVNYSLGRQMGVHVLEKGRLRYVKHDHLMAAKAFYERWGPFAIVACRFIPIIRTFTPFVAGVAQMSYRKFGLYNIAGGIGWVMLMTGFGYVLGQWRPIRDNFEIVVVTIVFISVLPLVYGAWKGRRSAAAKPVASAPV